jgi:hypothetical protein
MRGKYRPTFLCVPADGDETTQSADLTVEMNRTLPVVVEGALFSMASLNQARTNHTLPHAKNPAEVMCFSTTGSRSTIFKKVID